MKSTGICFKNFFLHFSRFSLRTCARTILLHWTMFPLKMQRLLHITMCSQLPIDYSGSSFLTDHRPKFFGM